MCARPLQPAMPRPSASAIPRETLRWLPPARPRGAAGDPSPPKPLLEPPHGSWPPAPARRRRAGGRDGRLRAAPEAARAGVRALIGVRAAAAPSVDEAREPGGRAAAAGGRFNRPLGSPQPARPPLPSAPARPRPPGPARPSPWREDAGSFMAAAARSDPAAT